MRCLQPLPGFAGCTRRFRPNDRTGVLNVTKLARRSLARQVRSIDAELAESDAVLRPLVAATASDQITR